MIKISMACLVVLALNSTTAFSMNIISEKTEIDQHLTKTCQKIQENLANFKKEKIRKATRYFTAVFEGDSNGELKDEDRWLCLNMEGSCLVGDFLYNYPDLQYVRSEVIFKFGKGNGESQWNKTNALSPCQSVAVDQRKYPQGTVLYIPSMKGKICPQNGQPVDGCFMANDVGGAIRGRGRFDMFTGECLKYNRDRNTCDDEITRQFSPKKRDEFYVVPRKHELAKEYREEVDAYILNGWKVKEPENQTVLF